MAARTRFTPICSSPISMPPDPPVFAAPWEAQAFALAVALSGRGVFTWAEWSDALAAGIAAAPHDAYYATWLGTLEKLVEQKSLVTPAERLSRIAQWER